jgi:pyruvate,orthophosphate dikinase
MINVYALDHRHDAPLTDVAAIVGGKAANLGVMAELGLPVPPGFTVSTAACRTYLADGWPEGLDEEILEHVARLEETVGRRFGDAMDPLLVSVRSGAQVSMPGMMDTILNVGLNDETAEGLARLSGDRAFVEACHARLQKMYTDIVAVATVPDDPWEQLRGAIEAVFRSWNSERARSYRAHEGISDDLGTAVTVQTMVFGNRSEESATGVIFTRNPATGEASLYGDLMFQAQGEDVVAGTHQTEPITVLDERMPDIAEQLRHYADTLERHYADACDIEFTIEDHHLWMLQTRIAKRTPQAAVRMAVEMAQNEEFPLSRAEAVERVSGYLEKPPMRVADQSGEPAATGLGASPGLVSGDIATTSEAAIEMAADGGTVILVRRETSPDDVHGMARSAGVLTSIGGLASHAAVVARGWGIPAVVGAEEVRVEGRTVSIGDHTLAVGDTITIDGHSGNVFVGVVAGSETIVPEAATLLGWARDLEMDIAEQQEGSPAVADSDETTMADDQEAVNLVVRALFIKGFATPEGLAPALGEEETGAILDRTTADGVTELTGAMFQLTADGKAMGAEMMASDREAWGMEKASKALDNFLPIDGRMKEIVTAWQMREVDGEPVLNDHTDSAYDASVLAEFASLHHDAAAWLRPLTEGLARLELYVARLERAADLVADGNHAYIASPTVDSYHSVWFELHEDLIHLADRTREDEVAAGRA